MSVNADDLPPALRQRLGLNSKARTRKAPSKAGIGHTQPTPGTCNCGKPFDSYAKWERHARTTDHTRWNLTHEDTTRET